MGLQPKLRMKAADILEEIKAEEAILDVHLEQEKKPAKRHDNTDAPPWKERPRKGQIGFRELSRGGQIEIRNARIKVLD